MDAADSMNYFQTQFSEFPRQLPENCVEYILVILDGQLQARQLLSALENLRKAALQLVDQLTKDYIWQRDGFQLEMKNEQGIAYLKGTSCYGDSVEDEWLIVFVLRELTKSFPNLWVKVFDSDDGEFLLVEAANVLPKWVSPEMDTNRAWIHQEKLYIIPLKGSAHEKRPLSLGEAVGYLKTQQQSLVQSTFIEEEAFYRLEKYPGQIKDSIHRSMITIPRKLAYILHEKRAAIAPAVEAFYLRDPKAMKPLLADSSMLHFPPRDLVTVSVVFTRVLFAQVKSQQFKAPPVWQDMFAAAEKEPSGAQDTQKKLAQLEIGMKVTCGFEMLATNAETKDNRVAREVAILLEDLEEDGDEALPSDADILSWVGSARDDDEAWLDINYEDFERELQGKRSRTGRSTGFGDTSTQADLQKIVSRFESFLNDDTAGPEGAELDDMDSDDDESGGDGDDDEDDSEDEDKEVSFDENQFAKMMREMMGLPPEDDQSTRAMKETDDTLETTRAQAPDGSEDEDEEIRQLAAQMEAELNEHGALRLDPTPKKLKALKPPPKQADSKGKAKAVEHEDSEDEDRESEDEVDIDYNLAKNLLESFKGQAGMAGPAGNLLGMLGVQLPRDEDDEEEQA